MKSFQAFKRILSDKEALLLQRHRATRFVTRNKSDLQAHSTSLVSVPFDRPYMISY